MSAYIHLEHRAGSSQGKHEGESSLGLCDRLDRTRDNSQRQLPTDHDYAVPTREYQTDQSSLKTAPTAARSVFGKRKSKPPKQTHRSRSVATVTPYQANALIEHPSSFESSIPFSTGGALLQRLKHGARENTSFGSATNIHLPGQVHALSVRFKVLP